MALWPRYVDVALSRVECPEEYAEAYIQAYLQRWGDVEPDTLKRVVDGGSSEDRLFAIFALGAAGTVLTRETLLPLLESPMVLDRWASAICLGEIGEEQAILTLCTMLTEFLPTTMSEYETCEQDPVHFRYAVLRMYAPNILYELGSSVAIPALRQGLQHTVKLEAILSAQAVKTTEMFSPVLNSSLNVLRHYQDTLAFALGRLGALGALTGVQTSERYVTNALLPKLQRQVSKSGERNPIALYCNPAFVRPHFIGLS